MWNNVLKGSKTRKTLELSKTITTNKCCQEYLNSWVSLEVEMNTKTRIDRSCFKGNEVNKFHSELPKEILDDSWDTHIYLNSSRFQSPSIKLSSSAIIWSQSPSKAPSSLPPSHPCSSSVYMRGLVMGIMTV